MNWLDLLRTEARATSMQRAANRLGISRTAVSLCLAGRYPAGTGRIEAKVLDVLGQVDCLALGCPITPNHCRSHRERKAPLHNPVAMQIWRTCQHCPHNPDGVAPTPHPGKPTLH